MFEQDRVLMRLQQRVLGDPDVAVCFLSGSYGRGTQDDFSDLDVTLVFESENRRQAAFSQRRKFVQSVLPYVPAKSFDAAHIRPYFHVALYANGAKVDFRYETVETLKPSPPVRETRMLKDSDGWGQRFQEASAKLRSTVPLPTITSEALSDLDNRFWVMLMDVYRQLLRGEHDRPFTTYLQVMYFTLPELLRLLPPEDPAHQALIQARYSHDTQATAAHLVALSDAYLDARAAVVRRHNLGFTPDTTFERELRKRFK